MSEFRPFEYSMSQVTRAGDALKGELIWSDATADAIREIFRIANAWRESHAFPMRSVRHEIISRMGSLGLEGVTAARLKRMRSIRKKLRTITANLNQIQDLGGCRAILPSISDVRNLVSATRDSCKHRLFNEKDYVAEPKLGGYRCHHLMFQFRGTGRGEPFDGRRIEVQIRTRLQHSWATAVEAVGLFRREDMKAGKGNPQWLRLFELMSAELAVAENCPQPNHLPEREERTREVRALDRELRAVDTLEQLRYAIRFTDTEWRVFDPKYYRIEYDQVTSTVSVRPHFRPIQGIHEYDMAEEPDNIAGSNRLNTVFVEADKIEDLKEAYPNYFGDVQVFCENLKRISQGEGAREYTMPPRRSPPPPPPKEPADMSWFRPGRKRRWK